MSHVLFSDVRLKFLFFREVKRFCFEDAYECVRVFVYVFVHVISSRERVCASVRVCVCVCVCVCARVRERIMHVCLYVTLFCLLLK